MLDHAGRRNARLLRRFALIGTCTLLALGGCDRAASPQAVERRVEDARSHARVADAKAAQRQVEVASRTDADLAGAVEHGDSRVATAAYDLAVTDAEGVHRVAVAACAAQSAERRKACLDRADATLNAAKAYAKASLAQLE